MIVSWNVEVDHHRPTVQRIVLEGLCHHSLRSFFHRERKLPQYTMTTGYDPRANIWHRGKNSALGLTKALSAKCLSASGLGGEYWSYAVRYSAQSLMCTAFQKRQRSPPFGSQVTAQALGRKQSKYPAQCSISGRLMFWDHLSDQGSYTLCPPSESSR